MKGSSNDNGKVSDSGYTNTCVSQSQKSSGSSLSRVSNRSESSGYCGGHPSAIGSSNYALPRPISKRKDKEHKKKKTKTSTALVTVDTELGTQIESRQQTDVGSYDPLESSSDFTSFCKKSVNLQEEVVRVESIDATDLGEHNGDSNSTEPEGGVGTKTNPLDDITSNTNEGFCAVISLHNGLIIDTTPSLKSTLGYTREEWSGRSFIDFVHPKDKSTFADHLVKNIALPYGDSEKDLTGRQTSLFCSLQKLDEGRLATSSGSDGSNSVIANTTLYLPFHLTTAIKYFRERKNDEKPGMMLLTITAQKILHIYKAPEETIISTIFSTRHDPNCILTHVDENVVQYLGYMPQDMIGRSLFDFYHPEDLPFIKDVYETVVKMEGSPFRSKPYRFATQNGGYVVLETEWSSFVNPWRKMLEFVVGHHRILRGPANPDVFQQADGCQRSLLANISEEVFKESKIIQGEIRALLNERIQRTDNNDAFQLSSRSRDLVAFVENLLQEVNPPALVSKDRAPPDTRSLSETDGVMLGAISPHHEYCDSKSSTETPPSYNQLNYNEKIERFFKSQPLLTAGYGSDEDNVNSSGPSNDNNVNSCGPSNDDIGKSTPNLIGTKDTTPNGSGGSGSGENLSSGSNNRTSYGSRDDSDNARSANNAMQAESFKLPTLTESLLNKHNIDMEKLMAQQHKERRCTIKNNKLLKDSRLKGASKKSIEKGKGQTKNKAGKRGSSRSPEGRRSKISKHDDNADTVAPVPTTTANTRANAMCVDDDRANVNIWPSVAVAVSSQPPHFCIASQNSGMQEVSRCPSLPSMIPVYYVQVPRIRDDVINSMAQPVSSQFQQNPYASYAAAPMATVIYPPLVCAPTPVSSMYRPFVIPATAPINRETAQSNIAVNQQENTSNRKRPASQATSIKAEPGSTMAMSEFSKKLLSPGEHFSSCVSIDGGCSSLVPNTKRETNTNSQFESSLEDSSDSSFYGSFLNTSSDSSCIPNQKVKASQKTFWKPTKIEKEERNILRKGPPWQVGVKMTNELIYQYQMTPKPLSEVLEADMKALKSFSQPQMVNDQLAQLYSDMELGGRDVKFLPIDRVSCSDSKSGSCNGDPLNIMAEPNIEAHDSMMSFMYEENAPLPSPCSLFTRHP